MGCRTVALALWQILGFADASVQWQELGCPKADASESCSYRNPSTERDMAVSLFFQVEDSSGAASFQCLVNDRIQCKRAWSLEEQGSAGTCFFILPAGAEFACSGSGTVNILGSHGAELASQFLSDSVVDLGCTDASCEYSNDRSTDEWVNLVFDSPSKQTNSFRCDIDAHAVCSFATEFAGSSSSCSFLLPAGKKFSCRSNSGSLAISEAKAQSLKTSLAAKAAGTSSCPPESADATLCDCDYENTAATDMIVSLSAGNVDGKFNSFHCYVGGANVCAWGANNAETGAMGQCYFVLPAGESYACQMQWGATAFPSATVWPLGANIFPSTAATGPPPKTSAQALHVPATRSEENLAQLFAEFQARHGAVEHERFANFKAFVSMVDNHPSNLELISGAQLSPMAVLSREEFEERYRNCARVSAVVPGEKVSQSHRADLPSSFDWRDHGAVTPVKDQGQCGSCWSFSTTGVLEGAWAAAGHGLESLSEQHLVSCDNQDGNAGCNGGWPYKAMDYVKRNGIDTEESYPYQSAGGSAPSCQASSGSQAAVRVVNHTVVESDEEAMAAWVAKNGPLSVSVDAMTQLWWPYTGGILSGCCNTEVDHAVLIVGYGEEAGQKYWLIKNSWSESWGEGGYIRLERGTNQCGITYQPVGAVVSGSPVPTPVPTPPAPTPTPSPTPPPSPSPTVCPDDAKTVSKDQGVECLWQTGEQGLTIPAAAQEYCEYIKDGYFGYYWDTATGDYECAASAQKSTSNGAHFCIWRDGEKGMSVPVDAAADCGDLQSGRIGIVLPSTSTLLV